MNAMHISGMIVGFIGLALVIYNGGWMIGLGVWLMIWGNNMERAGDRLGFWTRRT